MPNLFSMVWLIRSQTSDFVLSQELTRSQSHTVWFRFSRQGLTTYQAWLRFLMLLPQPGLYECHTQPRNTHIPGQLEMCSLSDERKKISFSLSRKRWYLILLKVVLKFWGSYVMNQGISSWQKKNNIIKEVLSN